MRRYRRTVPPFTVRCRVLGAAGQIEQVEVRDISAGGVRVYSEKELQRGQKLSLEFNRPDLGLATTLHGEIVWAKEGAGGGMEAGVKFTEEDSFLANDLLAKISAAPAETGTNASEKPLEERRERPRLKEKSPIEYRPVRAGWFTAWHATQVIDLSGSGVAFRSLEEIEPNSLLSIRIDLGTETGRIRARGVVVRCERESGDTGSYRVALQFLEMSKRDQHLLAQHIARQLQASLGQEDEDGSDQ